MPVTETLVAAPGQSLPSVVTEEVTVKKVPSLAKPVAVAPPPVDKVEEPKTEAPPAEVKLEAKEEPKEDPRHGKRFAELAKRQRELLQKEEDLKAREAKLSPIAEVLEKKDPLAKLQALGLTYEELTDYILRDGQADEPSIEQKVEALVEQKLSAKEQADKVAREAKEAEEKAAADKAEAERIAKVIEDRKAEFARLTEADPDKYELTHKMGQADLAWDVTEGWYTAHGVLLKPEEALAKVEAYLEGEAQKLLQSKKFQKQPEPVVEEPVAEPQRDRAPARASTLSNRLQTSASPASEKPRLSREESAKRAASLLKFK
jgi:hypothetical protein